MEAYSKVTDCILNVIQCDTRPEMLPAQVTACGASQTTIWYVCGWLTECAERSSVTQDAQACRRNVAKWVQIYLPTANRMHHANNFALPVGGESSQSVAISELIASAPKQIFALVPDEAKQSSDGNSENDLLKLEEIQWVLDDSCVHLLWITALDHSIWNSSCTICLNWCHAPRIGTIGINYGKKDKNPIDQVSFYLTSADTVATKMETQHVSLLIPKVVPISN